MKTFIKSTAVLLALISFLVIVGCSNDNTARVNVRLTDAPADYEALLIDIQGVQVNSSEDGSGWVSLDIEEGVYDILTLTNGLDTLLGSIELPAGKIEQIRLILGTENSLVMNGVTYFLTTPSAQQSGLKLNLHKTLTEGITYTILLDFDAGRSVVQTGNGKYILKPVIRAIEEATSGAISGMVTPADSTSAIYTINGVDTVATAFTNEEGKFLVKGVPEGTYTVSIVPTAAYLPVIKTDVIVTVGSVTDLGTIEF